jgi:copper chaperone CopZ
MNQSLHITGMTCGGCVRHVKDALLSIPGVREANVDLEAESAIIVADRDVPRTELSHALDVAGYALE